MDNYYLDTIIKILNNILNFTSKYKDEINRVIAEFKNFEIKDNTDEEFILTNYFIYLKLNNMVKTYKGNIDNDILYIFDSKIASK